MATFTDLGTGNSNSNPASSMTLTTTAAINAGDKVIVTAYIPNDNPTAIVATIDGQAMIEDGRVTRTGNGTTLVLRFDDATGRATSKTVSVAWTNSGASDGGGAIMTACKTDSAIAGGPDTTVGNSNGLSQTPTTGASGTPASSSAKYIALAAMGAQVATAGQATPNNSYTAMAESILVVRTRTLYTAFKEFASPPVAAQTETWTVTWGANKQWQALILMYPEAVVGAPVNTTPPTVSGTNNIGDTLSTTDGAWTNTPTSFAYDWQRDVGSGGSTWVSIDTKQSVTTSSGSPTVTVSSIVPLITGMPIYGAGIPVGAVISEILNATTITISANATASATVTAYFGANNVNSYVISADDLGCKIRCRVTATNANGDSTPASSNAVTAVPVPNFPTFRTVVAPVAQSDNQTHSSTLRLPVLAGETLVYLGACSVNNVGGDIGSITDSAGDTWTLRQDASILDSTLGHGTQAFSTVCAAGMAFGATVTTAVKQTTVTGANALNSATINVGSTAGFDAAGVIVINGINVTYTGITPTSLTGCGTHAAYTGGESVHYHGQSPYWMVIAINPGSGATCTYDTGAVNTQSGVTSFTTGTATASGGKSVALAMFGRGTPDVFTPGGSWTKIHDGPFANAGNPYTGESTYCATAVGEVVTGAGSVVAAGTVPDFQNNGNVLVVFTIGGGALSVQAVPANGTFSALASNTESVTAVGNTVFSSATPSLAETVNLPSVPTATFSGLSTVAESVPAPTPATATFSAKVTGSFPIVNTTTPGSVTFSSPASSLQNILNAVPANSQFTQNTLKISEVVSATPATVTFDTGIVSFIWLSGLVTGWVTLRMIEAAQLKLRHRVR